MITHIFSILIVILLGIPFQSALGQEDSLDEEITTTDISTPVKADASRDVLYMSLQDALDMGLRLNATQKIRDYKFSELKLNWDDAYDAFWFPTLSLTMSSGTQLVDKWKTDNTLGSGTQRSPNGYVGLEFDEYTVFNWGKDYLDYLNAQTYFRRQKQLLGQLRDKLRLDIIEQYFAFVVAQKKLTYRQEQLRQTSFMYRFIREKVAQRKSSTQELFQIKEEFLRSQTEYREANIVFREEMEKLATLTYNDLDQPIQAKQELQFKTLKLDVFEAQKIAQDKAPLILAANANLEIANRSFEKGLKDRMPLPKFSVKLGAYRHNLTSAGASDTYLTDTNNRNLELVASLNMKWTIMGSGGWFNSRNSQRTYVTKRQAEISVMEAQRQVKAAIKTLTRNITALERKMDASNRRINNAKTSFDKTLDRYMAGKTGLTQMKLALDSLNFSQNQIEETKYEHLKLKLNLAYLIGLSDFPRENFENLVMR